MSEDTLELARIDQRLTRDPVHRALRALILDGALAPGDRIIEADIAEKLGVSRGPVREALAALAEEGLVCRRAYKGSFVTSFSPSDVREIYSLRALIEGYAARLAAVRAEERDIEQLRGTVESMARAVERGELDSVVDWDIEFHRQVCEISGHSLLLSTWSRLSSRITLFLGLAYQACFEPDYLMTSHYRTVDALANHDPDLTEATMRDPIIEVGEAVACTMEDRTRDDSPDRNPDYVWQALSRAAPVRSDEE